MLSLLTLAVTAGLVAGHVDIVYPAGQWTIDESVQETGAFCGGGNSSVEAFISIAGDAGDVVTVRGHFSTGNTTQPRPTSIADFNVTLASDFTLPEGGNACINLTDIPDLASFSRGALGVIYVQATSSAGGNVSACANIALSPTTNIATFDVEHNGEMLRNPDGSNMTYVDFYCPSGASPAPVTTECACHCHGEEGHCVGACEQTDTDESNRFCVEEARLEAAGTSGACDCHCHGAEEHCEGTCDATQESAARQQCAASVNSPSASLLASQPSQSARSDAASTRSNIVMYAGSAVLAVLMGLAAMV